MPDTGSATGGDIFKVPPCGKFFDNASAMAAASERLTSPIIEITEFTAE